MTILAVSLADVTNPESSQLTLHKPPTKILSDMSLSDWRGSLTTFSGFTGTIAAQELKDVGWPELCGQICPPKPAVLEDKKNGKYFVPCALKEAPLIGETLKTAQRSGEPTTGKMRSKSHVTEASLLVVDVDGLPSSDFNAAREKMKADGISLLIYTTYSYGSEDKPDVRVRLVIPLDRPVTIEEYESASHGFDARYFEGRVGAADPSGAKMYQQQGTWCCHPDRVKQAKSQHHSGGVASADAMIELGKAVMAAKAAKTVPAKIIPIAAKKPFDIGTYPPSDANKVADNCRQIGRFRDSKGADQSEPLWYDCIGITGHCQDGEAISQDWSSGYSGYDELETASKIAHRIKTPPTTCDQFRTTNPDGCHGCTQQCHSPISLGHGVPEALASVQEHFCLINIDGKIWGCRRNVTDKSRGVAKKLTVSNRSDCTLHVIRYLRAHHPNADAEQLAKNFFSHPNTICYDGVEFNPNGTSGNYLNLWDGPTIRPKAGLWPLIQAFLLLILCDGDQKAYDYLIRYLAHALQRPSEKPGVMIILLGGQGTGKGTFGRILQKIWGATYIQVNTIGSVTGNFNATLECAFIVFMDEAMFAGDRRASDALKSLVTEETIHVNEKYQPPRQTKSYHRFIAATNAEQFKNTERDDRRDFTLRVSESRKGDHGYWKNLNHEIENGGVEAMAHDLLAMDLSNFNVRDKPNTREFLNQKLLSLGHVQNWWYECLYRGALSEGSAWPEFVGTKEAIEAIFEEAVSKVHRKPTPISFVQEMVKLCPSAKSDQKQAKYDRRRGLTLPSLHWARGEFDRYIGAEVPWPEGE